MEEKHVHSESVTNVFKNGRMPTKEEYYQHSVAKSYTDLQNWYKRHFIYKTFFSICPHIFTEGVIPSPPL